MNRTLHLTNGAHVLGLIKQAGIAGRILPWDDVLHEGPVPAGLGTAALRELRADFLASCGWESREVMLRTLTDRDAVLDDLSRVDEIVLWFEHDLYDQLLLLQILNQLPTDIAPRLTAVPNDTYLGLLPVSAYPDLFTARRDVTSGERIAARDGWDAFRAADPRRVVEVLPRVTVMRHLGPALKRHLEQFPALRNGLSRTEQQTLEAAANGHRELRHVYAATNRGEEAVFMADSAFLFHIRSLFEGQSPLLRRKGALRGPLSFDEAVDLTEQGQRVLSGAADRVALCGIDRWLGGVQLRGRGPVWRWDHARQTVRSA